jgi:hypothetical protein
MKNKMIKIITKLIKRMKIKIKKLNLLKFKILMKKNRKKLWTIIKLRSKLHKMFKKIPKLKNK